MNNTQATPRRTFAIISHPDAGKSTLTEKVLLYSGAIHLAGSVQSRRAGRKAVSDWMKIEQERGISIASSVLQFEYQGHALNLLDTPGHADFSEDTYRTLAAVDSAVMLIDHAKGVEARTRKLFDVCRMRRLPIVTFMNKLDRPGLEPLELLDEVGRILNLKVAPMNWPIGMGPDFRGVVDLRTHEVLVYEGRGSRLQGQRVLTAQRRPLAEAGELLDAQTLEALHEDLELLEIAGDTWDPEAFERAELSPVFWGSAMTNFGVEPLLQFLTEHASPPRPRQGRFEDDEQPTEIRPDDDAFSGFVFKIQANMNPRHRDRVAFVRVVSGHFQRDMSAIVGRTGKVLKLASPHTFMAQERSIVEDAWPGDIVGLYDPGNLRIGDTIAQHRRLRFQGIPRFAPEHFARMTLDDPGRRKQFDAGLQQLSHEGVVQVFYRPEVGRQEPYLGVVGRLQFEVLRERLLNEYRVKARLAPLPFRFARWVRGTPETFAWLGARREFPLLHDRNGSPVLLMEGAWALRYAQEKAPDIELFDIEPI